jgi:hypothetical protein
MLQIDVLGVDRGRYMFRKNVVDTLFHGSVSTFQPSISRELRRRPGAVETYLIRNHQILTRLVITSTGYTRFL